MADGNLRDIENYNAEALSQIFQLVSVSKVENKVECKGSKEDKSKEESCTEPDDWREHVPSSREIMLIASFGETELSGSQVVPKRMPGDQEGSNQWMRKEIDLIQELYRKDPECQVVFVCPDFPGTECPKDYYIEKMRQLLTDSKKSGALIWYTGHGEKNTGNWCFKDGVITFHDIFGLYMDYFRGKPLTIVSDCSYSGKWVKECIKMLDSLGIPSCGHYTKEQGIQLKVYCSCEEDQEAIALIYGTEGAEFYKEKYVAFWVSNKIFSCGQKPFGVNFTLIRCRSKIDMPCDIHHSHTWEDRILYGSRLFTVRGKDQGRPAWHLAIIDKDKVEEFKARTSSGRERIDIAKYGKILKSGFGEDPPKEAMKVFERYYSQLPTD